MVAYCLSQTNTKKSKCVKDPLKYVGKEDIVKDLERRKKELVAVGDVLKVLEGIDMSGSYLKNETIESLLKLVK